MGGVEGSAGPWRDRRTAVGSAAERNTLIAWHGTKRGLNIPAAQILGPGRVVAGLADVVDAIGEPELSWAFLCREWPFEEAAARPLDRLNGGRLEEVLAAAAGFGATFA